jgi:hypothetical protein
MSRLLTRAVLIGALAGLALLQLEAEPELIVWEMLLVVVVILEIRKFPTGVEHNDPPLFGKKAVEPPRLPRAVANAELTVLDAVNGHIGPDRRLHPMLYRIVVGRLGAIGVDFDSRRAVERLGAPQWDWLAGVPTDPPDPEMLERLVSAVEAL